MSMPLSVVPRSQTSFDRQTLAFLRHLPLFDGRSATVVEDLARRADVRRIPRGTVLWSHGDPADQVFFIRSGVVSTSRSIADHDVTLDYLGRGELVGVGGLPRGSEARMHEDGTLVMISRQAFDAWLVEHPRIAGAVLDSTAGHGRRLAERLALVSMHGAKARLSLLLMDLADRFGVRDSRGVIVDVRLTHRELAALIGATRETVSVAIVELRNAGLIATESRRAIVLDGAGLRAVAGA